MSSAVLAYAIGGCILGSISIASAAPTEVGDFATVSVNEGDSQGCARHVPACVVGIDENGTTDMGDDRVDAFQAWRRVSIELRPGAFPHVGPILATLLPTQPVGGDPTETSIPLPVLAAVGVLDGALIDPLHAEALVTLEVGEERTNWSIAGTPDEDGIHYGNGFFLNRTHLTPIPPGATLGKNGSDSLVRAIERTACPSEGGRKLDRACDLADASSEQLIAATPALDAGATVPRADVQPNAPLARPALAAAPTMRDASFPVAQAPNALVRAPARAGESPAPLPLDPATSPQPARATTGEDRSALATARATEPQPPRAPPAGVVAAAAAATALAALAGVPLWRLYKRVQDRDLARQETRAAFLAYVREHPGARLQETADAVGVQRNAIVYHARRLARAGALVVRAERRATRFFLPGTEVAPEAPRATLDHPVARTIVLEIARGGPLARRDLRERVRAPPRTVDWHLARLEREGVVAAQKGVRGAAFVLAQGAREAAIERALAG